LNVIQVTSQNEMIEIKFQDYQQQHLASCLDLFDLNCPTFFAENERADYVEFLSQNPVGYFVAEVDSCIVAAFGLIGEANSKRARISWIMITPEFQHQGIGSEMMAFVLDLVIKQNVQILDIAASHLSAPFFKKHGAVELSNSLHGWGPGMHRVDMEIRLYDKLRNG